MLTLRCSSTFLGGRSLIAKAICDKNTLLPLSLGRWSHSLSPWHWERTCDTGWPCEHTGPQSKALTDAEDTRAWLTRSSETWPGRLARLACCESGAAAGLPARQGRPENETTQRQGVQGSGASQTWRRRAPGFSHLHLTLIQLWSHREYEPIHPLLCRKRAWIRCLILATAGASPIQITF